MRNRQQRRAFASGLLGLAMAAGLPPAASAAETANTASRCSWRGESSVPAAQIATLARGFNLTGWFDGPQLRRPALTTLADLHRLGFTHVRLPVDPERLLVLFSSPDVVAATFSELDRALQELFKLGYGVVLDIHPGSRFEARHKAAPEETLGILQELWRELARRYAHHPPARMLFEVLNEPAIEATLWQQQLAVLVRTIRGEAPRHTIVASGPNFQRIDALSETPPLPDPNLVYAVHFYDPMIFTHQGEAWSDGPLRELAGIPFPASIDMPAVSAQMQALRAKGSARAVAMLSKELRAPWTTQRVEAEVLSAATWSARYKTPISLNEFGVLSWKAPRPDRLRWLETVRTTAEENCLGWTHWEYADAFGFVRRSGGRDTPDPDVLRALLGKTRP